MYGPGKASRANMAGLCDDMQRVVMRAYELSEVDFSVIESSRTIEQQQIYIDQGVSWTMDSDHLRLDNDQSGVLAVDLYPWVDGRSSHSDNHYRLLAKAMFRAAGDLHVPIKWGGFWTDKRQDKPHWAKRRS